MVKPNMVIDLWKDKWCFIGLRNSLRFLSGHDVLEPSVDIFVGDVRSIGDVSRTLAM